jgi:hypothetical protein
LHFLADKILSALSIPACPEQLHTSMTHPALLDLDFVPPDYRMNTEENPPGDRSGEDTDKLRLSVTPSIRIKRARTSPDADDRKSKARGLNLKIKLNLPKG